MFDWLIHLDQSIFLFLNGLHADFLDPVFFWGTKTIVWTPLYIFLLYLVIRKFGWNTFWILLTVALMIMISDQLSNFFKEWVSRPRPSHEPSLPGVHHVNGYKGGAFGFYSAHASSNMAIAIFLIILLRSPFSYFAAMMLLYALFMSYTRIYLGVHYPGDILAGWLMGGTLGFIFSKLVIHGIEKYSLKYPPLPEQNRK
jgi:undecaprenyl-diphosphatase